MTALDPADVARLISKLNEIETAATRAQLHIAAGCPGPANSELVHARTYIGQALRIAQGNAQEYVPDVGLDTQ